MEICTVVVTRVVKTELYRYVHGVSDISKITKRLNVWAESMFEWTQTKSSKDIQFESLLFELKYQKDYGNTVVFHAQRPYVRFSKNAGVHWVFNLLNDYDDDDVDNVDLYRRFVPALA